MPTSKIEKELCKATKIDPDDHKKRQALFDAILVEVNAFKDPAWNKLSEPAQEWVNTAIKAKKADKWLPEFDDVGDVKPGDDDDKASKSKKKAKAEEADDDAEDDDDGDDDDEKPAKGTKAKADDDDDEDDEDDDEDEDDEKPAKGKKKAKKKAKADDDDEDDDEKPSKSKKSKKAKADDDDDDDKPAKSKKKAKPDKIPQKASGVKVAIKTAIVEDPEITVDAIVKKLGKGGADISKVTVSNVRADFRHSLKLLKELGKLKGVDL